ncbi:hypothetical protein GCM10011572_40190 [Pseudoduganella buxea]|uniref:Uncharacterized protein n=1 Tax=Pseudoduganella buxea TaxID=1949069 RepID=A0ABQ1KYK7_9BURK|nr:hypothetical protein GCM10011572_40190 [Pseudoduganella buxea]
MKENTTDRAGPPLYEAQAHAAQHAVRQPGEDILTSASTSIADTPVAGRDEGLDRLFNHYRRRRLLALGVVPAGSAA